MGTSPPRVTVADLIRKFQELPEDLDVYVMDAPDSGDMPLCILDVYEWEGMAVVEVDTNPDDEEDRPDNMMGYAGSDDSGASGADAALSQATAGKGGANG